MKRLVVTITLLISSLAYAQSNNVAAVSWGLDNIYGFQEASELIEKFLCNKKSTFKVSEDNLFEVDTDASLYKSENSSKSPESFESTLDKALNVLNDKNSILIVAINSHGLEGIISRRYPPDIDHEEFIKLLFSKIDERQKNKDIHIHLILFYDACHSNSILDYVKQFARDNNGKYSDGCEKYKYKIDLYTSASADKLGHGNIFWEVLLDAIQPNKLSLGCKKYCLKNKEKEKYLLLDGRNSHNLWSSYQEIDAYNYSLPKKIRYLEKTLDDSNPQIRRRTVYALGETGAPEVIPYLVKALNDDYVKREAVIALGKIGTSEVIPYLGEALVENNDIDVKVRAADALGKIGTSEAISYLKEALNDNNDHVKWHVTNALEKIRNS